MYPGGSEPVLENQKSIMIMARTIVFSWKEVRRRRKPPGERQREKAKERKRKQMILSEEMIRYIENHRQEAYSLLLELARIPAPPTMKRGG